MISLRVIDRTDAARLCAVWSTDLLPGYSFPTDAAEMEVLIDQWNSGEVHGRRFRMLLIEADGMPAGLVSLYERDRGVSFGISVHPSFQRRGIGKGAALLAAEFVRQAGWNLMISQCREDNAASVALHEAGGFVRTGIRMNAKGNRVICWEKRLADEKKERVSGSEQSVHSF